MNEDVEAPCEECGGLLPLKAIQSKERHPQSCSLHLNLENPGQPKEKSRGKSSHYRQPEHGSTSQSEGTRLSSNSDGQAELTSSRNHLNCEFGEQFQAAKPAVISDQFRAVLAGQKAKKEVIQCAIHEDPEHTERKPNKPAQSPARQHPVNQKKTASPRDRDLPCHLHQHDGHSHNESNCMTIVGHDNASDSSPNPSVSTALCKVQYIATQVSCKRLLASRREDVQDEATSANSSQSGSASGKTYNRVHEAPEHQRHEGCRSRATSPSEPYPKVIRLYEACHLHHAEEHITASQRDPRKAERCGNHPERGSHTQPQDIITAGQHVHHQSVVQHHEVCHLHRDDAAERPMSRDSTNLCEKCGLPEPAKKELPPQGTDHHLPDPYVKIESLMITPPSGVTSPCILHGDCWSDTCKTCWHPKADHANEERNASDDESHKNSKNGKIHPCHLHREPSPNPKRQEPKAPKRATKQRLPCTSVRWLNRIIASQNIPPHIIREFLQRRRVWPPNAMKQKCPACIKNQTDKDKPLRDSPSPLDLVTSWNPTPSVPQQGAKDQNHNEKLTRLLMARTQIIKPIVKLSTSKETWRSRKELQFCSECWHPTKFGRWSSLLNAMSKNMSEAEEIPRCDSKFPSCTPHGNPNPNTPVVNLHRPELFSTFHLRLQAQKLQNKTFDRNTALQVAQMKCIKVDKKALAHIPEKCSPPRVSRESPSLRRCHDAIAQKRQETYIGLTKIVQTSNRICQGERPSHHLNKSTCKTLIQGYRENEKGEEEQQHMIQACKQACIMVAVCHTRLH